MSHDAFIRGALRRHLRASHPKARVFEEVRLGRGSRIDLVAVEEHRWVGFELKSARDCLNQHAVFQGVKYHLDQISAVFEAPDMAELALRARVFPGWWGIALVPQGSGEFVELRSPGQNPLDTTNALFWCLQKREQRVLEGRFKLDCERLMKGWLIQISALSTLLFEIEEGRLSGPAQLEMARVIKQEALRLLRERPVTEVRQ